MDADEDGTRRREMRACSQAADHLPNAWGRLSHAAPHVLLLCNDSVSKVLREKARGLLYCTNSTVPYVHVCRRHLYKCTRVRGFCPTRAGFQLSTVHVCW